MSEPAKTERVLTGTDKDHTRVLDMLNSAEMQKRLEEARARREKVLAERAAVGPDEPQKPAIVRVATAARMIDPGRTPLLLVEPMRKPPLRQDLPRRMSAGSVSEPEAMRPEPAAFSPTTVVSNPEPAALIPGPATLRPQLAALRPESAPQKRRRFQPSGLVMGLAVGLAAGAGLMQFMGPETPAVRVVPGTEPVAAEAGTPVGPLDKVDATVGSSSAGPSGSGESVLPRTRPGKRPDVGLIVLPKVASTDADVPDSIPKIPGERSPAAATTAGDLPTTPPVVTTQADTVSARTPPLVTLHLSSDLPDDALLDVRSALREAGTDVAATRVAGFGVARSEVRFFHERDAADAMRIAERMGAVARDFSTYRPVPPPGTLEVWLAGRG